MEERPTYDEAFLQGQIDRLEPTVTSYDLWQFGRYSQKHYASLGTEDRYWAIVHTRTNKIFVEGVLRIVAGKTETSQLSADDTLRLIELASPLTLDGAPEPPNEQT